jgi:hypothetical protein
MVFTKTKKIAAAIAMCFQRGEQKEPITGTLKRDELL